jgi:hypothetical protein
MPWTQVKPEDLVVGKEYALTRKGLESRTDGAPIMLHEQKYGLPISVLKRPAEVVAPPTALKKLEDGYRALITWKEKDADYPESGYSWERKTPMQPMDIRKKGFFVGARPNGILMFTQQRSFGASKPLTFEPMAVNTLNYSRMISAKEWAFWTESKNNTTKRNNGGLNRLAQMKTLKAQHAPNSNNWVALNAEEAALRNKYLGGKSRSSRSSRKRSSRKRSSRRSSHKN